MRVELIPVNGPLSYKVHTVLQGEMNAVDFGPSIAPPRPPSSIKVMFHRPLNYCLILRKHVGKKS